MDDLKSFKVFLPNVFALSEVLLSLDLMLLKMVFSLGCLKIEENKIHLFRLSSCSERVSLVIPISHLFLAKEA